jgi:hypothetical protein
MLMRRRLEAMIHMRRYTLWFGLSLVWLVALLVVFAFVVGIW